MKIINIEIKARCHNPEEIEAIDISGKVGEEELKKQCNDSIRLLGLEQAEFIDQSYNDMIVFTK